MVPKRGKKYSFIKKGFRNNRWVSELTDHQFSPSTEGTDNKMKINIKFSRRKMFKGEKTRSKVYTNDKLCSCSKLPAEI